MAKKKRLVWATAIILAVILSGMLVFPSVLGMNKSELSTAEIAFNQVELTPNALRLSGTLVASALSYRDCEYEQDGSNLYITLQGGLVTKKHPDGDFDISIRNDDFSKVDRVYLKHGEDHVLIYPQR